MLQHVVTGKSSCTICGTAVEPSARALVVPVLKGPEMLFRETVIAGASGSLGGITASHNRFGAYLRARVVPVNPNTDPQASVRALMSQLTNLWANTLSAAQRDAWDTYAANVPVINRIGATVFLTGLNHYIRSNLPRVQAGFIRADDAPLDFNLGDFTPCLFTALAATDDLGVAYTGTDDWVSEDGAGLIVFASRPRQNTINFFRGPYRLTGVVAGDATTPPTPPASFNSLFALGAGQKVFFRVRVTRGDGRLSASQFGFAFAV